MDQLQLTGLLTYYAVALGSRHHYLFLQLGDTAGRILRGLMRSDDQGITFWDVSQSPLQGAPISADSWCGLVVDGLSVTAAVPTSAELSVISPLTGSSEATLLRSKDRTAAVETLLQQFFDAAVAWKDQQNRIPTWQEAKEMWLPLEEASHHTKVGDLGEDQNAHRRFELEAETAINTLLRDAVSKKDLQEVERTHQEELRKRQEVSAGLYTQLNATNRQVADAAEAAEKASQAARSLATRLGRDEAGMTEVQQMEQRTASQVQELQKQNALLVSQLETFRKQVGENQSAQSNRISQDEANANTLLSNEQGLAEQIKSLQAQIAQLQRGNRPTESTSAAPALGTPQGATQTQVAPDARPSMTPDPVTWIPLWLECGGDIEGFKARLYRLMQVVPSEIKGEQSVMKFTAFDLYLTTFLRFAATMEVVQGDAFQFERDALESLFQVLFLDRQNHKGRTLRNQPSVHTLLNPDATRLEADVAAYNHTSWVANVVRGNGRRGGRGGNGGPGSFRADARSDAAAVAGRGAGTAAGAGRGRGTSSH